jgi:hypothetical protein
MLLSLIFISVKFRNNLLYFLIILLFYDGFFASFGDQVWNIYKIILPLIAFYCTIKYSSFSDLRKEDYLIFTSFLLFSLSFMFSAYLNGDYFNITFSQYAKYVNLFLLFFIFKKTSTRHLFQFEKVNYLIFSLLIIQILLTILKFLTWGFRESVVGSISFTGGAVASVLPILGFIFIWFYRKGILSQKDWIFTILLMFISVVSMKRAVWFVLPAVIFMFLYYVPKKKVPRNWVYAIPIIPIAFYFAVRLNPTFNREGTTMGSFDMRFILESAREYTFGSKTGIEKGQGRGGAVWLLFDNLLHKKLNEKSLFGYGLKDMYTTDYDQFDTLGFGLNHKGSATGVFQSYVSTGYIGVLFTIFFAFSILRTIKDKRLRYVIIGLFCWEYFFYTGSIIRNTAIASILVFIIAYANREKFWYWVKNRQFIPPSPLPA